MDGESIAGAFLGGLLSFFSPCFLPLMPAMLAYISTGGQKRNARLPAAIFFVIGFTLMFSLFGIALGTVLYSMGATARSMLSRAGGLFILISGLSLLGVVRLDFPGISLGLPKPGERFGMAGPFLMGCAFSLTLSPCFSFILGAIVVLASVSAAGAFPLFFAYSMGIALPFLAFALLLERLGPYLKPLNRMSKYSIPAAGAVLVIFGLLALADMLPVLS